VPEQHERVPSWLAVARLAIAPFLRGNERSAGELRDAQEVGFAVGIRVGHVLCQGSMMSAPLASKCRVLRVMT